MTTINYELIAGVLNSVKRSEIDDHTQDDTIIDRIAFGGVKELEELYQQ
jgi:hypothetical protein